MTDQTVLTQLTRARTALLIDMPFFGELCLRLKLVEDERVDTMAVDGRNIFYNPKFVASMTLPHTKFVLGHETMHCVYEHLVRRGDRNPKKWNVAGDFVINAALKDSGFDMPPMGLFNPAFAGMSTDQIYNLLPEEDGNDGEGNQPLDQLLEGAPGETETLATDWKIATVQAANSAKAQGKLPSSMDRFIDEILNPKVDWRDQLRRFITEKSKDDYSWMRPNRRFAASNLFLPSLYSENMGVLVTAIDTSGSIGQDMLNAFGSEITAAWNASSPKQLVNIYCDSAVNHVDTFDQHAELTFKMHGGGGTDFRPPFAHVEENSITPACFIYLTDGYGDFPASAPDYPVLWCMTTNVNPPWGEVIRIEV